MKIKVRVRFQCASLNGRTTDNGRKTDDRNPCISFDGIRLSRVTRQWRFHPHQQLQDEVDGSTLIKFRASGLQELADHIFTWGGGLEIVAPAELRLVLQQRIRNVQELLDKKREKSLPAA